MIRAQDTRMIFYHMCKMWNIRWHL